MTENKTTSVIDQITAYQRVNTFTRARVCIVTITSWTDALETPGCVATPASGTQVSVQGTLIDIYSRHQPPTQCQSIIL